MVEPKGMVSLLQKEEGENPYFRLLSKGKIQILTRKNKIGEVMEPRLLLAGEGEFCGNALVGRFIV